VRERRANKQRFSIVVLLLLNTHILLNTLTRESRLLLNTLPTCQTNQHTLNYAHSSFLLPHSSSISLSHLTQRLTTHSPYSWMSIPRPHSRGAPSSSSRPHSTHSSHSQSDAYIPPTTSQGESDFDFCNSFWVTPSTRNGSEERDWGREGYECLMTRVKSGGKVLEDLRTVLKER